MIPIIAISIIFITIGFIVNKNNAKYILAGYNTMSEIEKQDFDIDGYIAFFRIFHFSIGASTFVVATILHYFVSTILSNVFFVIYPMIAYSFLVWKSGSYYKGNNKIIKGTRYFSVFFIAALSVFILYDLTKSLKNNILVSHSTAIEICGDYGLTIANNNIRSIELIANYPEISSRSNGFALGYVKKGMFVTKNDATVRLLINSQASPLLKIVTKDHHEIYYSSKSKSNVEIYNELVLNSKKNKHGTIKKYT